MHQLAAGRSTAALASAHRQARRQRPDDLVTAPHRSATMHMPPMKSTLRAREKKMFFFEKKNQKAFVCFG
jgi:hypothetical protein